MDEQMQIVADKIAKMYEDNPDRVDEIVGVLCGDGAFETKVARAISIVGICISPVAGLFNFLEGATLLGACAVGFGVLLISVALFCLAFMVDFQEETGCILYEDEMLIDHW